MCEKTANRTQAQQHVMHQLEPSEKPDLSKTAISGKHFWIILPRVFQNFGPESSQGWAPERERERGRKRIGRGTEGERRREQGGKGGGARGNTSRGTAPQYGKKRQAPRTAYPRKTPAITFTLTSPKVVLLTTLAARWAGDCCKNDMFYNTIARP